MPPRIPSSVEPPFDPPDPSDSSAPSEPIVAPEPISPDGPIAPEEPMAPEEPAGRRARAVRWANATKEHLEARRPGSLPIDTVFRALEQDTDAGGGVLAGAVAFRVFLFMVPYVFFVVVGLGVASTIEAQDPSDLARKIGIGGLAASGLTSAADLTATSRVITLFVSAFATFWGARSLVKVVWVIHQLIWRVHGTKVRSSQAAAALIGVVTIGMALAEVVSWIRYRSFWGGVVALVLYTVVPFGIWLLASMRLPHADCPWWALVPGSALFAVGTEILHVFTVTYVARLMETKSETYGVIGFSLALLFWAYLLGRLMTASAVVNSAFWARRQVRDAT